ncbi:hypothetical protein Bhyg_14482 [Pseudolycoriella hygida]|uniref:Uncharacterized protein n=1 Tax=Pseudolycoriella hygida TaxID=35572 RepID=A0A9Q0MQ76_9DIPT|nr:hypothetical protein Bhyg_14482 [Pseudolycoriella hygida]
MLRTFLLFVGLSCVIGYSYAMFSKIYSNQNKASHGKQKRALEPLFVNGNSIVKIVLGVSFPLETYDKVNFRTLNLAYNFQGQYMLAKPARYPWDKVKRSLHNQKRNYSDNKSVVDNTRQLMYNAVEMLMDRKGVNGKECLQRAICENAQSPITVTGVFHEILNLFLTENVGRVLSRQRRYLTFPKGSSLQLVFDGASPVVDYTLYTVVGLTVAVSWELPHNPFYYDDEFGTAFTNGILHRNDVNVDDHVQDSYYFGQGNLQENDDEYYNINKSETYQWNKLMNNTDPDLIITDNFPFIRKNPVVPPPIGKRSVDESAEKELFLKYHRRSRYDLYRLVEKYLDSNGVDGNHCLQRILCEVGQKKKESKVGTFVEEILKAIFHLPQTHSSLMNPQTIDYHFAHNSAQNCTEQFYRCKVDIWRTSLVL